MNALPTHILTVSALVRNKQNELLMINNPERGWEFPGGIVENGEDLYYALKREIKEETGVEAEVKNIVGIYSNIFFEKGYNGIEVIPTKLNIHFIALSDDKNLLTSDESIEVKWVSESEALQMITNDSVLMRTNHAIENRSSIVYVAFSNNPFTIHKINDIS